MVSYKLNVFDRLTLMGILPKEGSFVTLKVIRDLINSLGIEDEEFKEFDIKQEGTKVFWNEKKGAVEKEFEFGDKAEQIVVDTLKELDLSKKLEQSHFSLYEKFVKNGGN